MDTERNDSVTGGGQPEPAPTAGAAPVPPSPSATVAAAAPRKKSGNGWKIAIAIIAAVVVLVVAGMASCSSMMRSAGTSSLLPSGLFGQSGQETASEPNTIAIITMDGTIQYDGSACSPEGLKDLLKRAEDDANVSAVVLRVNSGGGTSAAGEEMSKLVKDCSKPVVVSAASIDASAAYEISSQADYLYAAKSSEVGAIGTAMQVTNYSGLLKMLGISVDDIVSADSKDSSYGTRALTKKERKYYQDMVDQINDQFIATVAEGRNMSKSRVRKLATGLPFTGVDAVDNGLFDEIGTLDDACLKASQLAGGGDDYHTMDLTESDDLDSLMALLGSSDAGSKEDSITISKDDLAKALKELKSNGISQ